MPNWCNNNLELQGPIEKLEEISKVIKDGKGLFNHILPIPTELADTQSPARDETEEQKETNKRLQEKHGFDNWYDWRVDHWGTKWDVDGEDSFYQNEIKNVNGKKTLCLAFDTAWAPPIGIYEELLRQDWAEIRAYYFEGGCDFAGLWLDGNDDCITVSDHEDRFFEADPLGKELDDYYNIIEHREEYRAEEEADKKNEELKKAAANA